MKRRLAEAIIASTILATCASRRRIWSAFGGIARGGLNAGRSIAGTDLTFRAGVIAQGNHGRARWASIPSR